MIRKRESVEPMKVVEKVLNRYGFRITFFSLLMVKVCLIATNKAN